MSIKEIVENITCEICENCPSPYPSCDSCDKKTEVVVQQIISEIVQELEKQIVRKEYIFTETINAQNLGVHLAIETIKKMGE